jgi:hypothetical protein
LADALSRTRPGCRWRLLHGTEIGAKKVSVALDDGREARGDAGKLVREGRDPPRRRLWRSYRACQLVSRGW